MARHPLTEDFLSAQLAGDRRAGIQVIVERGLARGVSVAELELDVIQTAQYEIGRLWEQNQISLAQEHVATAIAQLALAHMYTHLPRRPANGNRVLVARVEGDTHEMGPRIITDFLEMDGWDARFVGSNVPADSLVSMIKREKPRIVALSASMIYHVPALRKTVELVRALAPWVKIAAGGHPLVADPRLADELAVDFWATDARAFATQAEQVVIS